MQFFPLIFLSIWIVLLVCIIAKSIGQYIENENAPILTMSATIVDMRKRIHHHHNHHSHAYHVTFETENGERLELRVRRSEYNALSVGDRGTLTHQGTRYMGFER